MEVPGAWPPLHKSATRPKWVKRAPPETGTPPAPPSRSAGP
jgi:hypothetical protein